MKGRHHQELIEKTRGLAPVRTAVVHTTVCPTNTLQASCPRSSARQAPRGAWLPGSGASMCAMKQRKSVATTMGFTALDGLVVSQRRGSREGQIALAPTDWGRWLPKSNGGSVAADHTCRYPSIGTIELPNRR